MGDTESSGSASAPSSQPQAGFGRGYAGRRAPMGAAPSRGALGWGRGSEPLPCSQLSCPTASARPQDGMAKPPGATPYPQQSASPKKPSAVFCLGVPPVQAHRPWSICTAAGRMEAKLSWGLSLRRDWINACQRGVIKCLCKVASCLLGLLTQGNAQTSPES